MAYIIKNTSGLINTRLTDVGRRKLSQGNFNIAYFQIGDSEVNYQVVPNYNQTRNNILMPAFDAQNDTGSPQSNKQNIKYPYYVSGNNGNTYGIPFMDSNFSQVYNSAGPKGFFTGVTTNWKVQNSSAYTITSNYYVDLSTLSGQTAIDIEFDFCSPTSATPQVNDFVTIFMDGIGSCADVNTNPVLTYKIQGLIPSTGTTGQTTWNITLDRAVPNLTGITSSGQYGRVHIYPSGMTVLYDFKTPAPYWQTDAINFESPCDIQNRENTLIWNMNIPWSENPAGLFSATYEDYTKYGSVTYLGTKEYLGYQESSGQTFNSGTSTASASTDTFYYNSFDEKVFVEPKDQKAIAIIHYTNQDIDFVYGEKFATQPFDPQNPTNTTGLASHMKLSIPTLMWHKSTGTTIGQDFMIDPPNYDLCKPYYMKSKVNADMNDPGLRYFHLYDLNPDDNNNLNRVGKVFPDQQIIVIDDEEIVAALSNKANRNWTLPAPKLGYLTPNTCFTTNTPNGILTSPSQTMWVTYRLDSEQFTGATGALHCNYYSSIEGPGSGCTDTSQNVSVRFGAEFPFLIQNSISGFTAQRMNLLCQITPTGARPNPTQWRMIDVTNELSATTVGGYLTMTGITGTTFQISIDNYTGASIYNLGNYMSIPQNGFPDILNFGDEYYFYGNFETDIAATIYEMKYLINLGRNQFTNTSNPTATPGTTTYVTEIGLYDSQKDLIVISKLQSPEKRQGIQQYVVKLDF